MMHSIFYKDNNGKWKDFLGYSTTKKDAEDIVCLSKEMDLVNDIRNREYKLEVMDLTKELE